MMKGLFGLAAAAFVLSFHPGLALANDPFIADEPGSSTDNPAPSLGSSDAASAPAKSETAAAPKADPVAPAPPAPEAQAPVPVTSIPGKTAGAPARAAAAPGEGKDIYEQYDDYLEQEKERARTEKDLTQRSLFPHENGAWQLAMVYARNAFGGYNFNRSTLGPKMYAKTQGANLLLTWFPLKSLTFGRLGFGLTGGIYWSTFDTTTPSLGPTGTSLGNVQTKASPQEVTSYGARAVYEFDYWLGQILVPFAFIGADNVVIKPYSITVGTTSVVNVEGRQIVSQNFGGGMHFNLNRVEPVVASRALVNVGIRKFYLTYMALQRTGDLAGLTHNVALNFEF